MRGAGGMSRRARPPRRDPVVRSHAHVTRPRRTYALDELRTHLLWLEREERDRPTGLTAGERRTLRWLRRVPGVRQPSDPNEFKAIAKARIKRRAKAAKRLAQARVDPPSASHTPEDPCTPL